MPGRRSARRVRALGVGLFAVAVGACGPRTLPCPAPFVRSAVGCAVPCDLLPGTDCALDAGLHSDAATDATNDAANDASGFDSGLVDAAFDGTNDDGDLDASAPGVVAVVPEPCSAGMLATTSGCVAAPAVRLVAPLSTSRVSSQRPTLHWALGAGVTGARVRLCATRACTTADVEFDAVGGQAQPPTELAPGVHFWRVTPLVGASVAGASTPTWEFFVGPRSAINDRSNGTTLDVNGDGVGDVAVGVTEVSGGAGRVYVYHGTTGDDLAALPTATLAGDDVPMEAFGRQLSSVGDVNGDGFGDLGIATGLGRTGAAFVFLGGPDGVVPGSRMVRLDGEGTSAQNVAHGALILPLGDFDGDGYGDVGIASQASHGHAGIDIEFGGIGGPTVRRAIAITEADIALIRSFATADLDCDGQLEIYYAGNNVAGLGSATRQLAFGVVRTRSVIFDHPFRSWDVLNTAVFSADLNGDGCTDVVASNQIERSITTCISDPSRYSCTPASPMAGDASVACLPRMAADLDRDGFDDEYCWSTEPTSTSLSLASTVGSSSGLATMRTITISRAAALDANPFDTCVSAGPTQFDNLYIVSIAGSTAPVKLCATRVGFPAVNPAIRCISLPVAAEDSASTHLGC